MGTYHEGMFAHDGGNPDDVYYQAIYAHEAGHAVAQHVLGQPCKYITVTMLVEAEDSTNITMGYQRDTVRLHKILRGKRKLTAIPKLVMDEAIIRCAGPAAELRWCTERRFPIRVLFGSLTNHDNVQRLFRWASRQGLSHGRAVTRCAPVLAMPEAAGFDRAAVLAGLFGDAGFLRNLFFEMRNMGRKFAMFKFKSRLTATAALTLTCLAAAPAKAATPVTYVSGKGTDSGDCSSPAMPCRTFQFAVNQTSPGGEVKALDPADYRPVTINKSISITGSRGLGSIPRAVPALPSIHHQGHPQLTSINSSSRM
jgi:hypothetical protein